MSILSLLRKKKPTASVAKERLQIIISHERSQRDTGPDYLPQLQKEIVDVIAKYVPIDKKQVEEQVKVQLERRGEHSVLELNITMPEGTMENAEQQPGRNNKDQQNRQNQHGKRNNNSKGNKAKTEVKEIETA